MIFLARPSVSGHILSSKTLCRASVRSSAIGDFWGFNSNLYEALPLGGPICSLEGHAGCSPLTRIS